MIPSVFLRIPCVTPRISFGGHPEQNVQQLMKFPAESVPSHHH